MNKVFSLLTALLLICSLAACNKNDNGTETEGHKQPEAIKNQEPIPVSKAFQQYSVWFEIKDIEITRTKRIENMYVFDGDNLKVYNLEDWNVEDLTKHTDDQIIKSELAKDDINYYEGKFTLDIKLDQHGQDTSEETIQLYDAVGVNSFPWIDSHMEVVGHFGKDITEEEYVQSLEEQDGKKVVGDYVQTTTEVEDSKEMFEIGLSPIEQKVFDTMFAGVVNSDYDGILITRVEEGFNGFKLDSPNEKQDNITIEGK